MELQKVYGQATDLSGFESMPHDLQYSQGGTRANNFNTTDPGGRPKRGQSGRPGGRIAGLETIYLTKIPKLKPAMNMNVSTHNPSGAKQRVYSAANREFKPFRPTMDRFGDDPNELNVDTVMPGQNT